MRQAASFFEIDDSIAESKLPFDLKLAQRQTALFDYLGMENLLRFQK
jgi:hypothetical protein